MKQIGTLTGGAMNSKKALTGGSMSIPTKFSGTEYSGSYEVVPTAEEQTLSTKGYLMKKDVTVYEIPYMEVENSSGGYTVSIAS